MKQIWARPGRKETMQTVTRVFLGVIVVTALILAFAPAARAAGDLPRAGDPLTPEGLAAVAGITLSLLLAYVPGLSDRYNALPGKLKAPLMGVLLLALAAGVFAATCGRVLDVGITCDRPGVWSLLSILVTALVSNQGAYLLAVEPFKGEMR
jgi:hypothetical protein